MKTCAVCECKIDIVESGSRCTFGMVDCHHSGSYAVGIQGMTCLFSYFQREEMMLTVKEAAGC
jgi:hypothetical protein